MNLARNRNFLSAIIPLFWLILVCSPGGHAQHESGANGAEKERPKVVAVPQDVKEKTGVIVYVAWVWIGILSIVYILRLKIREADRLHRLNFFSAKKE